LAEACGTAFWPNWNCQRLVTRNEARIAVCRQNKERLVIRLDHKAPEQPSPEVCSWSKYNPLGQL
jgi:hypothetical protein